MPLYDFLCRDCDHESEQLVRSDNESPACPECGSDRMMRLLSVPAAHTGDRPASDQPPPGPCGSACGCFPDG